MDAYDRLLEIHKAKCEQSIRLHGIIGKWQGLADRAQLAMKIGDKEWLQTVVEDMQLHNEESEEEMKSWR